MNFAPIPLTAHLVSQPAAQPATQRGSVAAQGNDGTVVINLPSGPITVKIDKGSLPVGTPVVVSFTGDKVIIQPLPAAPARQAAPEPSGVLDITGAATPQQVKEALAALIARLDASGDGQAFAAELKQALPMLTRAAAALGPQSAQALQSVLGRIQDTVALPPDQITGAIRQAIQDALQEVTGKIVTVTAAASGVILKTIPLAQPPGNAWLFFADPQKALQWLTSASAPDAPDFSALLKQQGASQGVLIRTLSDDQNRSLAQIIAPAKQALSLEQWGVQALRNGPLQQLNGRDLLTLCKDLQTLSVDRLVQLNGAVPGSGAIGAQLFSESAPGASAALLQWARQIMPSAVSITTGLQTAPIVDIGVAGPIIDSLAGRRSDQPSPAMSAIATDVLARADIKNLADAGGDGILELAQKLGYFLERTLARQNEKSPASLPPTIKGESVIALDNIEKSVPAPSTVEELTSTIGGNIADTALKPLTSALARIENSPLQNAQVPGASPSLNEFLKPLGDLGRHVTALMASVEQSLAGSFENNPALLPQEAIRALFPAIVSSGTALVLARLDELIVRLSRFVAALPDPDNRNSQLLEKIVSQQQSLTQVFARLSGRIADALSSTAGREGAPLLTEAQARQVLSSVNITLGHPLDTLVKGLETAQVLARQAPTAEGTTQVVTLPVRVDDAWVPLEISFVKHQARAPKQKDRRTFALAMHIAPSRLGDITIHIQYSPATRQCAVNLAFARQNTLAWFERNAAAIRDALRAAGLSGASLHCARAEPSATPAGAAPGAQIGLAGAQISTSIDIHA
ncbi:MAG: hypothetical protein PHC61_07085 [Chitinivibrionales bacterium]|nr:hypothetical protein [Chitinivibrionales bacterium]